MIQPHHSNGRQMDIGEVNCMNESSAKITSVEDESEQEDEIG